MREETQVAAEACLTAAKTKYTADETARVRRPPYPLPDRLLPHRDIVLAEVERLRREGTTDATCVKTIRDTYCWPWSTLADMLTAYQGMFHGRSFFTGALMLMFSAGGMSAEEFESIIAQVPDAIVRNQLRSQLMHVLLGEGQVSRAEQVGETLEPFQGQDERFFGHRRVAHWFAQKGDAPEFFTRWPRLEAGRERHHMGELKTTLVQSVARTHGWRAALTVVADKRIGPKYRTSAFMPLAKDGELALLHDLFSSAEGRDLLDELETLQVLARALAADATRTGTATPEPFTQILHRVIALDPSERSVMRARDAMLLTLWPAYPGADALALARRSARTPTIRRELEVLHPEVARPDAVGDGRPG